MRTITLLHVLLLLILHGTATTIPPTPSRCTQTHGRVFTTPPSPSISMDWTHTSVSLSVSHTSSVSLSLTETNDWKGLNGTLRSNSYLVSITPSAPSSPSSPPFTLITHTSQSEYLLASDLDPNTHYVVHVTKLTEPDYNAVVASPSPVTIHAWIVDDSALCLPFPSSPVDDDDDQPPPTRVLWVGDSITCGFCVLGEDGDPNTISYEDASLTYWSTLCADPDLNLDCRVMAWSGRGVVENCTPGGVFMGSLVQRTLGSVSSSHYTAYDEWVPDVVSINLGTNDYGCGHTPPDHVFAHGYVELASFLANPDSDPSRTLPRFILGVGPMTHAYNTSTTQAASTLRSLGLHVDLVLFPLLTSATKGCLGHPNTHGQSDMASHLAPLFTR